LKLTLTRTADAMRLTRLGPDPIRPTSVRGQLTGGALDLGRRWQGGRLTGEQMTGEGALDRVANDRTRHHSSQLSVQNPPSGFRQLFIHQTLSETGELMSAGGHMMLYYSRCICPASVVNVSVPALPWQRKQKGATNE